MDVDINSLETVSYRVENPGDQGIAVISLNRDSKRNAQNNRMTYELNACYDAAARDARVKVIVLRAEGKHFSAGHDLRDQSDHRDFPQVFPQSGFTGEGQEGMMAHEEEVYFNMCWRWRNIPKPVIAAAAIDDVITIHAVNGILSIAWQTAHHPGRKKAGDHRVIAAASCDISHLVFPFQERFEVCRGACCSMKESGPSDAISNFSVAEAACHEGGAKLCAPHSGCSGPWFESAVLARMQDLVWRRKQPALFLCCLDEAPARAF